MTITDEWRYIYLHIMRIHHLDDNTLYMEGHGQFKDVEGIRRVGAKHGIYISSWSKTNMSTGKGDTIINIDLEVL